MRTRSRRPACRALMLLLAAALAATALPALEVPYLAGRVNDLADLLAGATEEKLEASLASLEKDTGAQVAVLTIPSLEGEPLEDYSLRVVETWKLGRGEVDDGVLLLVACGTVEIGARMSGNLLYRAGVIVAVGIGFLKVLLLRYGLSHKGARAKAEMEAFANIHTAGEWRELLSHYGFRDISITEFRAVRPWYPSALIINAGVV